MSEEQPPAVPAGQSQEQDAAGELFARLRSQVEFYFSPQNLARDTYLRNALGSEHLDMPTPRPGQFMCPVGVITNFPKVKGICGQFGAAEPPALLLAKALEGSQVVTVSSDGNWIGPVVQQLPPQMMGGPPLRGPHHPQPQFQQPVPYQQGFQQAPYPPNVHQQRMMQMMPPAAQQGEGAGAMQYPPYPPPPQGQYPNAMPQMSPAGSDSPSIASMESTPSHHQQPQPANVGDSVLVAVTDLPAEVNPIELLTAFTSETIIPKSAFIDGNTSTWFVAFSSETDAKSAIQGSSEKTIRGAPIRAVLNSERPASSMVSVTSASVASLSSMSAPGGQLMQHQQQPMPLLGHQPGYPLPSGPSPPPPMPNVMQPYPPAMGAPPYPIPPPMQMPPGAQNYPQQYYNPQQMQQVYPGNYMHPQMQQGGLQQPQQMPYPPPPPPQMGNRYGAAGGIPPPPPPRGYPGGPPPYPPYQGMPQYMGDGYGGYYHHGNPHRQYHDRHQGGGFHDHKRKNDGNNKKKKNKNHQEHRRDSLGSGSAGNNSASQRNYGSYGAHHQSRNANSVSPVPGGKWKKRGEHGDQFRRSHGHASPSFNRPANRHQNDRLSSSDTTPSPRRQNKGDQKKEIFSSSDFPGLGGGGNGSNKPDEATQQGNKSNNNGDGSKQQLVGYASALLKKKEEEAKKKEADAAPTVADNDVDSITRQTEAMEREILSEFHDLSLIGGEGGNGASSPLPSAGMKNQHGPHSTPDVNHTVGTASSADARSLPNAMPILPGPFPEHDGTASLAHASELVEKQPLASDVKVADNEVSPPSSETPAEANERARPPGSDDTKHVDVDGKAKPTGAWGGKRFADVI